MVKVGKIRLSEEEVRLLNMTPTKTCWLCTDIASRVREDAQGYFLLETALDDDGKAEHLRQVIGREPTVT